jgi:uncharacterized protein with PQ loop repeat
LTGRTIMHAETIIIVTFSVTNIFRLFAYLPQIALLLSNKDTSSVSSATWSLFFVSNGMTAIYAASVTADMTMSLVFLANTVCCAAIVALVHWKRRRLALRDIRKRTLDQSTLTS